MLFAPILLFLAIGILPSAPIEPPPEPSSKANVFKGSRGKAIGRGPSSRLDHLTQDELKKRADLLQPVTVTVLSLGRSVEGLEAIKERIVDVRITNPNPYSIFFRGRQYQDNKTITPRWNALKEDSWTPAGWDWCGTGVRDWEIKPNESIDLMFCLHPELKEQQIFGRFYKTDEPSVQSDCLLYEVSHRE